MFPLNLRDLIFFTRSPFSKSKPSLPSRRPTRTRQLRTEALTLSARLFRCPNSRCPQRACMGKQHQSSASRQQALQNPRSGAGHLLLELRVHMCIYAYYLSCIGLERVPPPSIAPTTSAFWNSQPAEGPLCNRRLDTANKYNLMPDRLCLCSLEGVDNIARRVVRAAKQVDGRAAQRRAALAQSAEDRQHFTHGYTTDVNITVKTLDRFEAGLSGIKPGIG